MDRGAEPGTKPPVAKPGNASDIVFQAVSGAITALVERFGWPGALLILAFYSIHAWATQEQKNRIIELYFLGHGILEAWPLFILFFFGGVAFLAQHKIWTRKERLMQEEIDRLAKWKARYQQDKIATSLHHTKPNGD